MGDARRIQGLDVLRGIAAVCVVIYHYTSNFQRVYGHTSPPLFSFHYGALGVLLFFLISGFVIFMTLEKTQRPRNFVRSRFSRLYPAYWAALLLTFAVLRFSHLPGRTPSFARLAVNFSMIQGLVGVQHVDGVYWTLQVELCFYTIMLVLFMAGQLRWAQFWLLALMGLRLAQVYFLPENSAFLQHHPRIARSVSQIEQVLILDYVHAFLIGITLYNIWKNGWRLTYAMILGICLLYSFWYGPRDDFYFTLGFVTLVYAASHGYLSLLENRVMLFLGLISYSLYLTHQNIGYVVLRWMEGHGANANVAILAALVVALAAASALTYAIERPALRLLRGKKPRDATRPAPAPAIAATPRI